MEKELKKAIKISKSLKIGLVAFSIIMTVGYYAYIGNFIYGILNPIQAFNNSEVVAVVETSNEQVQVASSADEDNEIDTPEEIQEFLLGKIEADADKSMMKGKVNLVFVGVDRNIFRYTNWKTYRTDSMMLVCVDFDNNKIDITSIPRDSLVWQYKFSGKGRVNSAFGRGNGFDGDGFEYMTNTISMMMGDIAVDKYFAVDMEAFKSVIDGIGGVECYVDVPVSTNDAVLQVGTQQLWGSEALAYCRQKIGTSDIARTKRQQAFILAVFEKLKQEKMVVYMPLLYENVKENVYTNLTVKQISALCLFATKIEPSDITTHNIEGGYVDMGGVSLWGLDQAKLEELIFEIYGVEVELDMRNDVDVVQAQAKAYNSAVAKANGAIYGSESKYILNNAQYLTAGQISKFNQACASLSSKAGERSLTDPKGKASEINKATNSFCITRNQLIASINSNKEAAKATPKPATPAPATPAPATPAPATPAPATPAPATPAPATPAPATPAPATPAPATPEPTPAPTPAPVIAPATPEPAE